MDINRQDTAVVITDPQNDFLSEKGVTWDLVGKNVKENNDLILQLSKRRINKVILCGMSANLCTESHMRELIERGFEVGVVKDATAAAQHPELGDGYKAALINFAFLADAVYSTDEVVKSMDA